MSGADFVRADLHVHTFPDSGATTSTLVDYVDAAVNAGVKILAVTDHNTVRNVRPMLDAAQAFDLLVVPGIEISTYEGHLLALFDPAAVDTLETFASSGNLRLTEAGQRGEVRSTRSMVDLVAEIANLGGLAIPAHVDAQDGIGSKMSSAALQDLLRHPGLAGLEFKEAESTRTWFTDLDPDPVRRAAWLARKRRPALHSRGLARLMSSDSHTPSTVGMDRSRRTLTRLKVGSLNFSALSLAIMLNPKSRCKAEALLPLSYPRIVNVSFEGGFLDGVSIDFSPNLTAFIGGRGSGKSTALIATRAALGATLPSDDDPDEPERMPDRTTVRFIDASGSERVAVRERGGEPSDEESAAPISLDLADLGQDESGRIARDYQDPVELIAFLDGFVDLADAIGAVADVEASLTENAESIQRNAVRMTALKEAEATVARLEASLAAAQKGKVEDLARWAAILATQVPMLARLEEAIRTATSLGAPSTPIEVASVAADFGVDLDLDPARQFMSGETDLPGALGEFQSKVTSIREDAGAKLVAASEDSLALVERWKTEHRSLSDRLRTKQEELEKQGLKVQAGAIRALATELQQAQVALRELRSKRVAFDDAAKLRKALIAQLAAKREGVFQARRAAFRRLLDDVNQLADGLRVHVSLEHGGMRGPWIQWLTNRLGFRTPRVQRIAEMLTPLELAAALQIENPTVLDLVDSDGQRIFSAESLNPLKKWSTVFELQSMWLSDRPRIEIQEKGSTERRAFDHLSAGQQRSVLLSLILCADRSDPLVLDQPEDHLDGLYVATSVVRHLEAAKERRQVIVATHSANLTVLGDAELVVPMFADRRRGAPKDAGAVDNPATRDHICSLLEGGQDAFRRRGERYGFRFR